MLGKQVCGGGGKYLLVELLSLYYHHDAVWHFPSQTILLKKQEKKAINGVDRTHSIAITKIFSLPYAL